MRVPRHTTAYGSTARSIAYSSRRNGLLQYQSTQITDRSVRLYPQVGGRVGGFRMPTSWGMHAVRSGYTGFDYKSSTTSSGAIATYVGNLSDPSHGFGNTARVTFSATSVTVQISANHSDRTRTEALVKIKEGKFNLGVAAAESVQTTKLLCDLLGRFVRGYKAVKRGSWVEAYHAVVYKGNVRSVSQAAAKAHLEGVYGWLPLLSDIHGAQEQIKKGFREKRQLFKVTREVREPISPLEFISPAGYKPREHSGTAWVSNKVVYWQRIKDSEIQKMLNLGVIDPLVIAWELRPFSFVLDWVLPVGSFLDALTATLGVEFVAGYEDRIVYCDLNFTSWIDVLRDGKPMACHFQQYSFQRVKKTTWDLPVPYWKNPFTLQHSINAIALLKQLT